MKYINTRVQSSIPTESYGRVRTTLSWFLFERASQSSHRDPQTGYPDKDHSLRHSLHALPGYELRSDHERLFQYPLQIHYSLIILPLDPV